MKFTNAIDQFLGQVLLDQTINKLETSFQDETNTPTKAHINMILVQLQEQGTYIRPEAMELTTAFVKQFNETTKLFAMKATMMGSIESISLSESR